MYKNIPTPKISQTAVLQLNTNPTSVDHRNVSTMAYHGVFTVYDILAFSIPHVWCLKINAYHIEYLRDERNNLSTKQTRVCQGILTANWKEQVWRFCAWDMNDKPKSTSRQHRIYPGCFLDHFYTSRNFTSFSA